MAALYIADGTPHTSMAGHPRFQASMNMAHQKLQAALCEQETTFVFALPESFLDLPSAISNSAEAQGTKTNQTPREIPSPTSSLHHSLNCFNFHINVLPLFSVGPAVTLALFQMFPDISIQDVLASCL